jgi:zinc protease
MFGLAPGVFYFYCGTDPEKLDDVQAALAGEVSKLAADGLTQEELARAKQTLLGKAAMDAQGISARASIEGLDELYQFGHDHGKSLRARVEKITLEDTHRVLKAYFCEKPSVTVRVSPLLSSSK